MIVSNKNLIDDFNKAQVLASITNRYIYFIFIYPR